MRNDKRLLSLFILALALLQPSKGGCPYECSCVGEPRKCPIGVSLIVDGCNCCKVCAKQRGERCDDESAVCDVHRNLFCDYTASRLRRGTCRARSGSPCRHDNLHVESGSMFTPSCKKRCWCVDGAIGCVPTCPHETQVPRSDRCPNARLRSVPGRCCDQWTCQSRSGRTYALPLEDFWNEYVDDRDDLMNPTSRSPADMGNDVREGTIYEDDVIDNGDELRDYQLYLTSRADEFPKVADDNWHKTNIIPGDIEAQVQAQYENREQAVRCQVKMSPWSDCSKTCGLGVSIRVTNSNHNCRLTREQRLCVIRPCNADARYQPKKGSQCMRQKRERRRSRLTYAGCNSVKKMKNRYCGSCRDKNRCCIPKQSETKRVQFRCANGRTFYKDVLDIETCHCPRKCPFRQAESGRPVRYALYGDMHRFRNS